MSDTDVAYAFCQVGDIPNRRAKAFSLLRRDEHGSETPWHIVVVRWDRRIHGWVNRCPHHGTELDWERNQFLDPEGSRLMCGKHGALFDIASGVCVEGPCAGDTLEPVALKILDGDLCVVGVTLSDDA